MNFSDHLRKYEPVWLIQDFALQFSNKICTVQYCVCGADFASDVTHVAIYDWWLHRYDPKKKAEADKTFRGQEFF